MVTFFVLTAAWFLNSTRVEAAPAGTWFSESELAQKYDDVIFPFYESMTASVIRAKDGVQLNYRKMEVPNERGAIVLVSGYGQSHIQFAELMYGLVKMGYSVYILDHRGLGFSARLIPNSAKIYVGSFYDYVYDLKQFMDQVVKPASHRNVFMLAHSMGGQVAMLYQTMYPGELRAMLLSSPLVEMVAGKHTELGALVRTRGAALVLMGKKYAPGQGDPDWNSLTLGNQTMTHSQARFDIKAKIWRKFPYTKMGGATYRWIYKTIEASRWMRSHAPAKMSLPVLMLEADQDTIVVPAEEEWMCSHIPNCHRVFFPGSYHELLWEKDSIRNAALTEIETFLEQQAR